MPAKKVLSMVVLMWILGAMFAVATFAQGRPAPPHSRKSIPRVGKSKKDHRGSQHKVKPKKR